MPKERFENRRYSGTIKVACKFETTAGIIVRTWECSKALIIKRIVAIVDEYRAKGYTLTLRQLHYQFVSRNWIVNHDTAYKKLGSILDDCRYSGLIDWDAIEDRGRVPYLPYDAEDVTDALNELSQYYRVDRQIGQPYHMELWTEKDALSGILRRTTAKYHIQLVVNKGYTSSSALYNAYQRATKAILKGQKVVILYFGDHDPSGLDMVRDIRDRLIIFLTRGDAFTGSESPTMNWFEKVDMGLIDLIQMGYCSEETVDRVCNTSWGELKEEEQMEYLSGLTRLWLEQNDLFEVRPIGLTMEQIKQYNLPHNPAKLTDKRAAAYVKKFGPESWEVDALNPETLTSIVETNIVGLIDDEQFQKMLETEAKDLAELKDYVEHSKKKKK